MLNRAGSSADTRQALATTQARRLRQAAWALLAGLPLALGGCTTDSASTGSPLSSFAMVPPTTPGSIAFESIDGPPQDTFQRLVARIDDQAQARRLPIASRDGPSGYRVRAYLAAAVRGGRTVVSWVWDVYDADRNRVLRVSGEETGGKAGRDPWAAADDQMLTRIARTGLDGVAGMLNRLPDEAAGTPMAFADPHLD